MTQKDRDEAFKKLPEELKILYSSPEAGQNLYSLYNSFDLDLDKYIAFTQTIGDTILGFYHTKDLPRLLEKEVGVSAEVSKKIVAELAEILAPVLKREEETNNQKLDELKQLHEQFSVAAGTHTSANTTVTTPDSTAVQNEDEENITTQTDNISPKEPENLHVVTPMRTMADDMTRIHGYGAYRQAEEGPNDNTYTTKQEELLKSNRPRLTDIPQLGE